MALKVQPQFVRALVRRASAVEAIGKHEMAVQDVKVLLGTDPTHPDALEIAQRLRTVLGPKKQDKSQPIENGPETKYQLKPSNSNGLANPRKENHQGRPLKLVYDHDITLAQMTVNCSFRVLRDYVSKTFPSSESVLINAEEKIRAATDMWEKQEELRTNELKDQNTSKKEELLRRRKIKGGATEGDISAEEAAEQATVMRSQIHLFWGNMLFERSQVERKLGMGDWKKNLDAAIERFKLAGASETDISMVIKNHCSNDDAREGEVKGSRTYNRIALVK